MLEIGKSDNSHSWIGIHLKKYLYVQKYDYTRVCTFLLGAVDCASIVDE